jgi:predicted site-specific integrase-resolvase
MRTIKPQQYIDENFPESGLHPRTIINWIKNGKLQGTTTPTGVWLVVVDNADHQMDKTSELVQFLES